MICFRALAALCSALLLHSIGELAIATEPAAAPNRPNVLFLFADDYTYEALGTLGTTDVETPNLDRLAGRGVRFSHAYNMGSWSGAVCVASRTMLITGRQIWDAHRIYNQTDLEREAGVLWPQLLSKAGYDTYFTGKWHIKADAEKTFDVAQHVRPGMPKTVPASYDRPLPGQPDPWSPYDRSLGGYWEGGTHWSEVVANDAIDFLGMAAHNDDPFFMYIAFNAPHDPRQSPREYVEKYPRDRVQVPTDFLPLYPYAEEMGAGKGLRDERLAPFPRTEESVQVHRGEYYALITHLDVQIGRILDALERTGKADSTWIVFTADHGLSLGHHGLFGKQNQYDVSVRVPFLVVGPGVPEGRTIDAPIYLQDILPTTLALAGVAPPEHVWFRSLLPLIRGETDESPHGAIYGAYLEVQRAITDDGYKLILYPKAHKARLFALQSDPNEMHDLADDPDQMPRMRRLFARLRELQNELSDTLDLATAFPDLK